MHKQTTTSLKQNQYKSTLTLPKINRPSLQQISSETQRMQAKLRSISIVSLRKAKLKYPSFTERRHSKQVEQQLAHMEPIKHKYANLESSSDSVTIMQDFIKDDIDELKQNKEAQLMLLKRASKASDKQKLPKSKLTHERLVGEEAIKVFYDRYKHISKVHEKEVYFGQQNPITFILSILDNYNLPPKRMEIIKLKGNDAILDLRNCGLGKSSGARIISELVSQLDNFQSIDLSFNEIGHDTVQLLIPKLPAMRAVNLSHNKIGKMGCQLLSELFRTECNIRQLELESNNLTDMVGNLIVERLSNHGKLRLLNLSKNLLSNSLALRLKKYLMEDNCLEELYLHWNEITDKGGKYLFDSLMYNKTLRVFDISWNALTGRQAASSICQFFQINKTLIHLDISFCDFHNEECKKLSIALEQNNTIYGIHFEGNMGYINYRGGLICELGQIVEYPIPIKRGILRRIRGVGLCQEQNEFKSTHRQDVCWICQGWQEVYFKISKPSEFSGDCYLHLDFEGLAPVKMQSENVYFDLLRICPVGDINFYFTMTPQYKEITSTFHEISPIFLQSKPGLTVNRHKVEWLQDIFQDDFTIHCHCLPRTEVHVLQQFKQQTNSPQVEQQKTKIIKKDIVRKKKQAIEERVEYNALQVKETSSQECILNKHARNDMDFYRQCLQFDIANSKLFKIINKPEDQKRFRQFMTENYQIFKTTYYKLCNNNVSLTGMYSVSEFNIQQFIAEQKYESKRVTLAKIMLKLYTCLMGGDDDKNKKAAEKSNKFVNRPQFLEFLIRLAQEKWCVFVPKKQEKNVQEINDKKTSKKEGKMMPLQQTQPKQQKLKERQDDNEDIDTNEPQAKKVSLPMPLIAAIERLIKTLGKYSNRVSPDYWRNKKYLTVDCELVYNGYESYLQELYSKYAGSRKKLKKGAKALDVDEFKDMFLLAELKKTREGLKDCEDCFLDAKAMECEQGVRPPTLDFLEFVEAFARYSDYISLAPCRNQQDSLWFREELRKKIPLFLKFESLIVYMYRRTPDLQNKNFNKIVQYGMFAEEADALLEIFKANQGEMSKTTSKFLRTGFKLNTLYSIDDISLTNLVSFLQNKYRDRTIVREEEVQYIEEVEEIVNIK